MLNKYRNPRSKRKLKAKAKKEAQASAILPSLVPLDMPSPPSPDDICRELAKTKRIRNEPLSFKKERELSKPYTANV